MCLIKKPELGINLELYWILFPLLSCPRILLCSYDIPHSLQNLSHFFSHLLYKNLSRFALNHCLRSCMNVEYMCQSSFSAWYGNKAVHFEWQRIFMVLKPIDEKILFESKTWHRNFRSIPNFRLLIQILTSLLHPIYATFTLFLADMFRNCWLYV